ncbi:uncharacterized protein Hap1MRO34_012053 [Clarias gariepinus]
MYFRSCVFAVVLGLVLYFLEFEFFQTYHLGCFCVLGFFLFRPREESSEVCECSTQTDCTDADETPSRQESENKQGVGSDELDAAVQAVQIVSHQPQYPHIQRSLQHMFSCAYTNLVMPWSTVPELRESQPLFIALLTEFNLVIDEIICKAKDLELSVTGLGCIQIFTQHLQNTKQAEGSPAFSSKAEEFDFIRDICKALIYNLFPKHLWDANVYNCVLQEILAMKALDLVTFLSDPDNLNQLIISQLNQMPSENLTEEVPDQDKDVPSSKQSEDIDVLQDEPEEPPSEDGKAKTKGKKLKEKFSRVFGIMKPKKGKLKRKEKAVKEEAVPFRRPAASETDDASSNSEGSTCDSVDTEVESLSGFPQEEIMEYKLSFEVWKFGNWEVSVTNVQMEENELCFTVHLEEKNNLENFHWDVKRNQSHIIQFYDQFKEKGELPSLLALVETPKSEWNKEEAREILEHALKKLLTNEELGNSELVFKFLGPLDWIQHEEGHDGWLWDLLGGIASFLTPSVDDELSNHKGDEKQHEAMYKCSASEATPQHGLDATLPRSKQTLERQAKETEDDLSVTDIGHLNSPEQTSTSSSEKDNVVQFFDHPEMYSFGIQSVSENIAKYATQKRYIKFEKNHRHPASAMSSSENDENNALQCTASNYNGDISKEENLPCKDSSEPDKSKKEDEVSHPKDETLSQPSGNKKDSNSWEQPEANKVIFELLKEISGNSYTFKFLKAVVTPFTQMINKKVNTFLKKKNPSEAQIATHIDSLCKSIWPDTPAPQLLPQSSDKNETKQKAMKIMTSKFAGFAINKSNLETIFKRFQDAEENKKLVYMLLMYLLRQFLPGETTFKVMSKLNVKPKI